MIGAARLDARVYRELRDDPRATGQAFSVLILVALALTLFGIARMVEDSDLASQLRFFVLALFSVVVEWLALSMLAYGVGRLMRRMTTFPSLLRTIGFAYIPWVLLMFIFFGGLLGYFATVAVFIWVVLAMIIALRETLQISPLVAFCMTTIGVFIAFSIRELFGVVGF